jgi:hypothetical protein
LTAFTYTEELIVTHCWCGIAVAIPENLNRYAHDKKGYSIYCPLGHSFVYGNNFEAKYEEERRRHQATKDLLAAEERAHRAEERSHAQTRGKLTRVEKRASAGVCPCCNRTFQQLARHMKSKHPEFVEAQ